MAGGLSIHAVDLTRGAAARGLALALRDGGGGLIAAGCITADGSVDCARALARPLPSGPFSLHLDIAEYFRGRGDTLPEVPFLDVVRLDLLCDDPELHIHLPFKFSPWGYSLFRGN